MDKDIQEFAKKKGISYREAEALIKRGQKQTKELQDRRKKQEAFMGKSMKADESLRTVNRDKKSADEYNKQSREFNERTKQRAERIKAQKEVKEGNQLQDMITSIHSATDKWGKAGSAALITGAAPGVLASYETVAPLVPALSNYISNTYSAWAAANPVASSILNGIFTGAAIGQMAGDNGVQKTFDKYGQGDITGGTVSLMGDLWNGYVAAHGLNQLGGTLSGLGSHMEQWPTSGWNPFTKTTKTTTTKAPYRVTKKNEMVDKAATAASRAQGEAANRNLWQNFAKIRMDAAGMDEAKQRALAAQQAINDYYNAPVTVVKTTGSYRPITSKTVTRYGLNFQLPPAAQPYGVPQYLPESQVPMMASSQIYERVYQPPVFSTGLNGMGRGVWRATTQPAPVRISGTPVRGGFPTPIAPTAVAPVVLPPAVPIPPVPGVPPATPPTIPPYVTPGIGQYQVITEAPTYNSAEIHDPGFESWFRGNYAEGDTGTWNDRPIIFQKSPTPWRRDATNGSSVSPAYQRKGDSGDYRYINEHNGYAVPEDTTSWKQDEAKAKKIKEKAKASGKTKTRKK